MKTLKQYIIEKSVSYSQQRLMGMAYAIRKGKLKRDGIPQSVLDLADSKITDKALRDFATTTHSEIEAMNRQEEYEQKQTNK